ncbi:PH domain-containing protein [Isoptericola sp. b441]|uniref:PH domain-containing protein n=1 Tax=Actinotalea lenta TaxID=3064654 RepID=A0ABT9D6Y3_9CELL|nr:MULTISPECIES: PH domain-containing protein [unclassified Isoptericola]MDO8106591.1 PH domain-containing protein [Isoptericola sp. b441]MDO8121701.1 PH domain-containing protein [Isoptericola sp. b490]
MSSARTGPGDRPGDPPSDLDWVRVHPITPVVRGWKVIAVLVVIVMQQFEFDVSNAARVARVVGFGTVGLVALGVAALGFAYATLAWRMTRYAVDDDAIYLHNGVLFRRQRAARLDRIQGIDTIQPLLARMFGLTELKIEVAGGADSAVRLSFLRDQDAQRLRNELLARAAGLRSGALDDGPAAEGATQGPGTPAPAAPERELVAVPAGRIIEGLLRSIGTLVALVLTVGMVVLALAVREPALTLSLLPAFIGIGGALWGRFTGEFGFRLAQSPDGIRLRHGLLEARAQTVPPGRVQAVRLRQPLLWRSRDWWRVEVNIAGYAAQQDAGKETVLLPVADRRQALLALWLVLPDLGVDDPARVLDEALSGSGPGVGFVTSPRRARWLDLWGWPRNAYLATGRALLARHGLVTRTLVVVPHERTQSIGLRQGPLQRRLGLASVDLHSTPGPVQPRVHHLDATAAGELVTAQALRARRARASAGPEQWMRSPAQPPGDALPAGPGPDPGRPPGEELQR